MKRREALKLTAILLGGTIAGSQTFLAGCTLDSRRNVVFADKDILVLDEVGETIIPKTKDSPGAKAARIGEFMKTIVTDCYESSDKNIFMDGIRKLEARSNGMFSRDFMDLTDAEKFQLASKLDEEATEHTGSEPHYFTLMKQLTLWGYFTSEPGSTQALRYIQTPGRYEGCIPYKQDDKAWAL